MNFCVYCGAALIDPAHCGACGAYKVGAEWQPATAMAATIDAGWRPDPTGRHEGRYFAAGQPTDLIRDGGIEGLDVAGKEQLDSTGGMGLSPSASASRRWWWVAAAVIAVLALIGGGVGLALYLNRDKQTVDDKYLADLEKSGMSSEFNSHANAVAHGKQVCRQLEDGGAQQGMPVDQVAVGYYCPQFAQGFHVLESITVKGTITINDKAPGYLPLIEVSDSSCSGKGGYSDITPGMQVTVKNGKGEILATTTLGAGQGGRYMCSFPFSFRITEGQDRYVVTASHRGDMSYSFADLKARGVELTLG